MQKPLSTRRHFLSLAAAATLALPVAAQEASTNPKPPKPPALPPDLVKEFVGAGHGDLPKTKRLLAEQPGLLNATWDWGGGDFETAIGGAGHMGRPDIASFLIEQGARYDLFVAAMLGRIEIVRAYLTANPALRSSKGPHGISLVRHAEAGGEPAKPVLEYLSSLG